MANYYERDYWIKNALGKIPSTQPTFAGWRGGRKYYIVTFYDEPAKDYYIDFDNRTIEEVT